MNSSVYKLHIFDKEPPSFEGQLYALSPAVSNAIWIDLSDDPFEAIQKAVVSAIGAPCGLVIEREDFFSQLFISLYEQLSLVHLETKHRFIPHMQAFLGKKDYPMGTLEFIDPDKQTILMLGSSATLKASIEAIKAVKDRYTLVSAYSTLPYLESEGIRVDMAFAVDPLQKKHDSKNAQLLVVAPKTDHRILAGFEKIALFPESYCPFSVFLFKDTPHPLVYGYTVIDIAVKYLIQMGFRSIALAGVSLEETGGAYVSGEELGYKPDFKKAKIHLTQLMHQEEGVHFFDERLSVPTYKIPFIVQEKCLGAFSKIQRLFESYERVRQLFFESLGLAEILALEEEPFFQVVMDPLCEKWMLFEKHKSLHIDKRGFYQTLMTAYEQLLQPKEFK